MPSKNTIKEYQEGGYYHVYNRGVEKRVIFLDDQDYTVFIGLLKKYLAGEHDAKKNRHPYTRLDKEVKLLSYCLMPNHFHLFLYQESVDGITKLMRRLATGYVMYFNNRYGRVGALFQGKFKASLINKDAYVQHISRYIHLNPMDYKDWQYSSYKYFASTKTPPKWLSTDEILHFFDSREEYIRFVSDFEESSEQLKTLKWQLANATELDL